MPRGRRGDDAFLNIAANGTPLAAPAATWYIRIGTTAPAVHNVTCDSSTAGALLSLLANSTSSAAANLGLTGGANGVSTWTVGADDTLRLSSGGSVAGATNVGAVNLVNAAGITTVDFVKEGAGRMHIQSTGSTFSGKVRINAGSLQINGNGSLGNTLNDVYIADGAMLTANNNATVAASRTFFLGSAAGSGTALLDAQGNFTFTVDSLLADNGVGADGLHKTNTGTVLLAEHRSPMAAPLISAAPATNSVITAETETTCHSSWSRSLGARRCSWEDSDSSQVPADAGEISENRCAIAHRSSPHLTDSPS